MKKIATKLIKVQIIGSVCVGKILGERGIFLPGRRFFYQTLFRTVSD